MARKRRKNINSQTVANKSFDVQPEAIGLPTLDARSFAVSLSLVLPTLFLGCFWEVLFFNQNFSFRDVGHFYHPLFRFIQQEWSASRLPLWNPYDNCGTPLIAMSTSSIFYPPKLLFFLPTSYDFNFKLFLISHFGIGLCGAFQCCRHWSCSQIGSLIAAISFAFGAGFLFQYCNVPFLCSSAWLPWGILAGARLIQEFSSARVLLLAVVLAFIVLCGDPQMAYHLGMMLFFWVLAQSYFSRKQRKSETTSAENDRSPVMVRFWLPTIALLLAAGIGVGLSAVQVLPTAAYSKNSVRSLAKVPRSVWEIPSYFARERGPATEKNTDAIHWYDAIVGHPPPPAKHDFQTYGFSLAPYRVLETWIPNLGGRAMPGNKRMWSILGERNVWMPSIYFGLLPFLLVCCSIANCRKSSLCFWLTSIGVVFLLACFGNFGPGWFWSDPANPTAKISSAVGGVYWFFVVFLPGYSVFRFPAKLWIVSSFCFSALAGIAWDDFWKTKSMRSRTLFTIKISLAVGIAGLLASVAGAILVAGQRSVTLALGVNEYWDLAFSFLQLAIVSALLTIVLDPENKFLRLDVGKKQLAVLLLLGIDLVVANAWTVQTSPCDHWSNEPAVKEAIDALAKPKEWPSRLPRRIHVSDFTPPSDDGSLPKMNRLNDKVYSLLHLPWRIQKVTNSTSTMRDLRRDWYFDWLPVAELETVIQPRRAFDLWGSEVFFIGEWSEQRRYNKNEAPNLSNVGLKRKWGNASFNLSEPFAFAMPRGQGLSQIQGYERSSDRLPMLESRINQSALSPFRVVRQLEVYPPISKHAKSTWFPIMMSAIFPLTEYRDLRTLAIVEDFELPANTPPQRVKLGDGQSSNDEVEVLKYTCDEVVLQTDLKSPGLLLAAETYDEGWQVFIKSGENDEQQGTVLRTNFAMRGVKLEAGEHHVRFVYRPKSFVMGAWISSISWIAVLAMMAIGTVFRWKIPTFSTRSAETVAATNQRNADE